MTTTGRESANRLEHVPAPGSMLSTAAARSLAVLRIATGFVFLWAFLDKTFGWGYATTSEHSWINGGSPTKGFLSGVDAGNYDLGAVSSDLADILRRRVTVSADNLSKPFGQGDPVLTYRITSGSLVAGETFSGLLGRGAGEAPGDYVVSRGSLSLSSNYDLTFAGAVFTIERFPEIEQEGSILLKHVTQSPDFTLDWDPELNLQTEGPACQGEGCPRQTTMVDGGKIVAALP